MIIFYKLMKGERLIQLEKNASELISEQCLEHGKDVVFLCSFSREDMIILNLLKKNKIEIDIYSLDTGRLPQETYDLMQYFSEIKDFHVKMVYPDKDALAGLISKYGPNLFYKSPELRYECCRIRKVEPMNLILKGKSAWITGIRSEQTGLRAMSKKVEKTGMLVKINPLLEWTYSDVELYTRIEGIEENKLYKMGYRSIGCFPCTRPVLPEENERDGRWWWEDGNKECGIHYSLDKVKP